MVVLGSVRVVCPHCRQVQYHPMARRYRCRACSRAFTAAAARITPGRALGWLLLGLGACTIDNPLFDAGASGNGGGSSSSGAAADASSTSSSTTVDPDSSEASSADSGADSHGEDGLPFDLIGECVLPEPVDLHIDAPQDPRCGSQWSSGQGEITVVGDTISVRECGCPCEPSGTGVRDVTVTGVQLDGLPTCGEVVVYALSEDDACVWDVLAVRSAPDSGPPRFVASRSLELPAAVLGDLSVELGEDVPCGVSRCEKTGQYALNFTDGMFGASLAPDDAPTVIPLPSVEGAAYVFDNVSAIIADDCTEHLVWTARAR
jgi:hypothetical protein